MQETKDFSTAQEHIPKKSILSYIDENLEKPLMIFGLLGSILLIVYQSLGRYIFSQFFPDIHIPIWTEELARFLFILATYSAIPLTIRSRSNIRVDIIYDKLSPRVQGITWIIVDIAFIIMATAIFMTSLDYLELQFKRKQLTAALQIPYYIPYAILPIGFGLMTIRLIQDIIRQIKESGLIDTLIGVAVTAIVIAPVYISDEIGVLTLLFGYFIILLLLGVPIAICLGLATLATIIGADSVRIAYIAQAPFTAIDNPSVMAIPFFIAAGVLMGAGGLSKRLLDLADYMLGNFPGGIALVSISASMFFAAISGSGPATVAAIGMITVPAMIERGYDKYFAGAVVAAAGAIGVMIPPSNPFVVYGITANQSVGKLFMGGIVPGLLTGFALMLFTFFYSKKKGWVGKKKKKSFKMFCEVFWNAKWALLVPVIILGGIYGGIMTPTEAAAVAAIYGLIAGMFFYGEITFRNVWGFLSESASSSAGIIILIALATLFGHIMTLEDVPGTIASAILNLTENKIVILLIINLFLLFVGTFMEALAAIVILTPVLLPIVMEFGVDPVHFGIIMVVNLAIGFVTPPVGVNLFVASSITNSKISQLSVAIVPLLIIMIAVLLVITYIPAVPLLFVN